MRENKRSTIWGGGLVGKALAVQAWDLSLCFSTHVEWGVSVCICNLSTGAEIHCMGLVASQSSRKSELQVQWEAISEIRVSKRGRHPCWLLSPTCMHGDTHATHSQKTSQKEKRLEAWCDSALLLWSQHLGSRGSRITKWEAREASEYRPTRAV